MTTTVLAWVSGALAILLVITIGVEELRIHNWQSDYNTQAQEFRFAQDDLAVSRGNVDRLQASLDKQNAAVKKLAQDAIDAAKAAQARLDAALATAAKHYAAQVGYGVKAMNDWMQIEYGGQQ